ncbi:MAG: FecR domain-containing protein [Saprospiraceae bacterium]|nr:FecR domain-containing protein [Saprospiraceae bacterium]
MENTHHDDEIQPSGDDTLLARWLAGDLSPEDLEALRNLEGYPDYVEMLHALEGMEMDEFSPTLAWQKLQPILEKEKEFGSLAVGITELEPDNTVLKNEPVTEDPTATPAPATPQIAKQPEAKIVEIARPSAPTFVNRKSSIVNRKWLAIAAALLFGVVGIWWFSSRDNFSFADTAYHTQAGEKKEVKLPDGSVVTLNAMSKLGFAAADWKDGRKVALDGEAYFKAKKGKTFTVSTEQGAVEVVGTIFNVYARGEELEVKCAEGRVQVINPEGTERVLLKAGEQVTVLRGKMQKRQGLAGYPNWFKGESAFRSAPLERVFGEMERQYGVLVLADSLGERTFSGKFVHKDLKKALKMVCDPMKLKCEVRGDTVLVK